LFAESLELLELRDPRHDFRVTAWQYTFTTSMQEQDNPADFRWRCLHADNPASNRFAAPDCRPLSDVRATRVTSEEKLFAQFGRQPPRFVIQPQSIRITDGQPARLCAKAEGVPSPRYQWFAVDKAGNGQPIANGTDAEIVLPSPPFGLSRYVARASNSQGDATSEVATLSVNVKPRLVRSGTETARGETEMRVQPKYASHEYVKSADAIDRQRRRLESEEAEEMLQKWRRRKRILMLCGLIFGLIILALWAQKWWGTPHPFRVSTLVSPPHSTANVAEPTVNSTGIAENTNPPHDEKVSGEKANMQKNPQPSEGFGLPIGWTIMTVGSVPSSRAECLNVHPPYRFDLEAAASGCSSNGDNTLFVCRTNPGIEFTASWLKATAISPKSRVGIMLRESQKSDSPFLFIGASDEKIFVQRRNDKGVFDTHNANMPKGGTNGIIFRFAQTEDGKSMEAYLFDSPQWEPFPDLAIPADAQMLVGFAQSSGSDEQVVKARLVDISATKSK
jgi:predicted nucleic acid-binding Zn ribbon protein